MDRLQANSHISTKIKNRSASMLSRVSLPEPYRAVFVQSMEQDLDALNSALKRGDLRTVLTILHRMGGAFAVVGISKFAGRCEVLEQEGRQNGLDDATGRRVAVLTRDLLKMLSLQ